MLIKTTKNLFTNTYKGLFTVLFQDSMMVYSESKELMAHDRKTQKPMKDKFVFIKSCVLLMCKL